MSRIEKIDFLTKVHPIAPLPTLDKVDKVAPIPKGMGDFKDSLSITPECNPFSSAALNSKYFHPQNFILAMCLGQEDLLANKLKVEKDSSEFFLQELNGLDDKLAKKAQDLIRHESASGKLKTAQDFLTLASHGASLAIGLAALTTSVVTASGTGISLSLASGGTVALVAGIGAVAFSAIGLTHFVLEKSGAIHKVVSWIPIEEKNQDRIETITNISFTAVSLVGSIACSGIGLAGGGVKVATLSTNGLQKIASTVLGVGEGATTGIKGIADVRVSKSEGTIQSIQGKQEITRRDYFQALDNSSSALDAQESFFRSFASSLTKQQERTHALLQHS